MNNVLLIAGVVCGILALLAFLMAIFLFFKLDIRGAVRATKGSPSKRQINRIRERTQAPSVVSSPIAHQQTWNGEVSEIERMSTDDTGEQSGSEETPDIPLDGMPRTANAVPGGMSTNAAPTLPVFGKTQSSGPFRMKLDVVVIHTTDEL